MIFIKKILSLSFVVIFLNSIWAQTTQVEFGKNRVQYKPADWFFFESANFTTYFHTGGVELEKFSVLCAEKNLEDIKQKMEFSYGNKIELLVFGDITDFNQSNIGFEPAQESYNIGGGTKVLGNKIFVYFDGDHNHLNSQIRQGIAKILMDNMLFGTNFQEIVQNAVLLSLPDWYTDGLIAYLAEPWSAEKDDKLRNLFNHNLIKNFNQFTGIDNTLAGESFWNYVDEKYDKGTLTNLLYMTRINRSMEAGFDFVLNKGLKETYDDWFQFYSDRYAKEAQERKNPAEKYWMDITMKKNNSNSVAKINNDGSCIAYVVNDMGRIKLLLKTDYDKKPRVIYRYGLRNAMLPVDEQNPVFTFDITGKKLFAFFLKRKQIYFLQYDIGTGKREVRMFDGFHKIYEINFGPDKNSILLNARSTANSDIYIYNVTNGKTTAITNDYWDEKNPHYVHLGNRKGIVFASNRVKDTLFKQPQDTLLQTLNFDIFFYDLHSKKLIRITKTKKFNETFPQQYNKQWLVYTSDQNGFNNRFYAQLESVFTRTDTIVYFKDSTITNPKNIDKTWFENMPNQWIDSLQYLLVYKDTFKSIPSSNYNTSITGLEVPYKGKFMLESFRDGNKMSYFKIPVRDSVVVKNSPTLSNTAFRIKTMFVPITTDKKTVKEIENDDAEEIIVKKEKEEEPLKFSNDSLQRKINPFHSIFQNEFVMPWDTETFVYGDTETVFINEPIFKINRVTPYRLHTYTSSIYTQLDQGSIMKQYQPFYSATTGYVNPSTSAWMRVDVKDIMEDYRWQGGINLPSSFNGLAYFIRYQNFRKRLDKQFTFYRNTETENASISGLAIPIKLRLKTNYLESRFTYPFNEFRCIRTDFALRQNNFDVLSTEPNSLQIANYKEHWGIFRFEYVHDNTRGKVVNILNGLRYKLYFEKYKLLDNGGASMNIAGWDFRRYSKIYRSLVWANRFSGATSFGKQKMLFYLGGVDSWMAAKFDHTNPVSNANDYAYQSLATNMRGFQQNVRNGNSYFVLNSEIRWAIYPFFSNKPINSDFIRNFQFIAFFDMGSAWIGPSPLSTEAKVSFTDVINTPPVKVEINYYRNPVVFGYGWGLRTTILGYFARIDFARGVDNNNIINKQVYVSLTTDF